MNIQNLQQKNGTLMTVNQKVFIHMKIQSSLCDDSDAYILVTGNIAVLGADNDKKSCI